MGAGRVGGYGLDGFKLNRDICTPVKEYMPLGQQEPAEDDMYHPRAFVHQVKTFILDEGNDPAAFQLLGIRPKELAAIQQPIGPKTHIDELTTR